MKMTVQTKGVLVAIEAKEMANSDNKYYKLAMLQGSEAINLSCTKEVYDLVPEVFKEYGFEIQISEYEGRITLRVTNIFPIRATNATDPIGVGKNTATPNGDKK